jgi:hypothetical protein
MFERIRLMGKKALLLSGFLNENYIKNIQDYVTGNNIDLETLKSILIKKSHNPVSLGFAQGKPKFDFIKKEYAAILNEYYKKYKEKLLFPQPGWSFKSVEICPLLCRAVFMDLDKVDYFQNMINGNNYEDILRLCLDVHEPDIKLKLENNGVTLSTNNSNIIGLGITPNLQILPQVNHSPVKVARINDRYELIDGKHRAVALYKAGYRKIPAIVFDSVPPYKVQSNFYFPPSTLMGEAPPTIGHYIIEDFISEVPLMTSINVFRILIDKTTIQV